MDTLETKGMDLASKGGNYSPVHVINNDTIGAVFLGTMAFVLLIAFLRAHAQNRAYEKMLSERINPTNAS